LVGLLHFAFCFFNDQKSPKLPILVEESISLQHWPVSAAGWHVVDGRLEENLQVKAQLAARCFAQLQELN